MKEQIIMLLIIQVIIIISQYEKIKKLKILKVRNDFVQPVYKPIKYTYQVFEYTEPNELIEFLYEWQNSGLRLYVIASGTLTNKSWIVYESTQKNNLL